MRAYKNDASFGMQHRTILQIPARRSARDEVILIYFRGSGPQTAPAHHSVEHVFSSVFLLCVTFFERVLYHSRLLAQTHTQVNFYAQILVVYQIKACAFVSSALAFTAALRSSFQSQSLGSTPEATAILANTRK
jgi:hypothetical protein